MDHVIPTGRMKVADGGPWTNSLHFKGKRLLSACHQSNQCDIYIDSKPGYLGMLISTSAALFMPHGRTPAKRLETEIAEYQWCP